MSPTSVESRAVLDELAFAVDEDKLIIPVLYRACKIPFRIRRLQHADFTLSYDAGRTSLMRTLRRISAPVTPVATDGLTVTSALTVDATLPKPALRQTTEDAPPTWAGFVRWRGPIALVGTIATGVSLTLGSLSLHSAIQPGAPLADLANLLRILLWSGAWWTVVGIVVRAEPRYLLSALGSAVLAACTCVLAFGINGLQQAAMVMPFVGAAHALLRPIRLVLAKYTSSR
jgi:hypothetical protein